ncbi:tetratricopeptide repeat protein [Komagataeibacter sp. FNDCF1]|uniref:tetratricopeptide repeat protein n=1 Tax=Komagataeibacter sp. FNDCF1 TaxID=2878681 RepID=UPI001E4CCA51|nr:SEL1-like repeat protein [Komagataeibacter sp. FNDCF1]MCE2565572.1 SEL1-like repeat protein [Komagataeibacter sp. FNDCF1]
MRKLLSGLLDGMTPAGRFRRACRLLEHEGRSAQGFARLGDLARQGMVAAQYQVARAYLDGSGVPRSPVEGVHWMHRAASADHAEACFSLALMLLVDPPERRGADGLLPTAWPDGIGQWPDPVAATGWAGRAARAGLPDAQALYGYLLATGPDTVRDPEAARLWSARAAQSGCPQGDLALAVTHLSAPDQDPGSDPDAVAALLRAAEGGLPTAQYMLGLLNERGWGMPVDSAQAEQWYARAAAGGVRPAQARYGVMLLRGRGRDGTRAVMAAETWLRRAALAGDREAAALLGDLHARGEAALPGDHEAVTWYRMAAEQDHAVACRMLAMLHVQGRGVAADPALARHWLERAATLGDAAAMTDLAATLLHHGQAPHAGPVPDSTVIDFRPMAEAGDPVAAFNLAVSLHAGVGCTADRAQAAVWMERAARAGVVNAEYWYGRMLLNGDGVADDPVQARHWLERAADHGLPEACIAAAQVRLEGFGGPRDHAGALAFYHRAASAGRGEAMFSLGAMYGGGHDIAPDPALALHWFTQGAQAGNALSQLMLGRYLARGLAGPADPARARHWFMQAAGQGLAAARNELDQMARTDGNATA